MLVSWYSWSAIFPLKGGGCWPKIRLTRWTSLNRTDNNSTVQFQTVHLLSLQWGMAEPREWPCPGGDLRVPSHRALCVSVVNSVCSEVHCSEAKWVLHRGNIHVGWTSVYAGVWGRCVCTCVCTCACMCMRVSSSDLHFLQQFSLKEGDLTFKVMVGVALEKPKFPRPGELGVSPSLETTLTLAVGCVGILWGGGGVYSHPLTNRNRALCWPMRGQLTVSGGLFPKSSFPG